MTSKAFARYEKNLPKPKHRFAVWPVLEKKSFVTFVCRKCGGAINFDRGVFTQLLTDVRAVLDETKIDVRECNGR